MAVKTVKTGWFRVAVSGQSIDGRIIKPEWLTDTAKNWNAETYPCRINNNHIRAASANSDFDVLGDVTGFKTQEDTIDIGGKMEKRTALYAQAEVYPALVEMKSRGQKLHCSVEIVPNFAGTKTANCIGLAVTDFPASLGTARLNFAAEMTPESVFTEALETDFDLVDAPSDQDSPGVSAFATFLNKLTAAITPPAPAPLIQPPAPAPAPGDPSGFAATFGEGMQAMGAALKEVTDNLATIRADLKATQDQHAELLKTLEGTSDPASKPRSPATGAHDFSKVI